MMETVAPVVESAYKASRFVMWAAFGSIVLTAYVIANTWFEKWWKYRETF